MRPFRARHYGPVILGCLAGYGSYDAIAQDTKPGSPSTAAAAKDPGLPVAAPGDQVIIKRDGIQLIDPLRFRLPLYLTPAKTVTLVAPQDGTVVATPAKIGDALPTRSEIARIDDTAAKLRLNRAQSLHKAAVLEQKIGSDSASGEQKELAQAKVDAAKADLDLAQWELDQCSLRIPYAGEVIRYLVAEGQFVRAGEPLAVVGDLAKMQVEIPVERSQVEKGKSLKIKVDGAEVDAVANAILPLNPRFDALRELFDSLTSATVTIDNPKRALQPGQTVFVPVIPRHPVVEVPTNAIGNLRDGGRKVQVLRDAVIRDIPVSLMGSVGLDRVFVNGPFTAGDEVIVESSHLLADGFPVRPGSGKTKKPDGDATGSGTGRNPATKSTSKTDF